MEWLWNGIGGTGSVNIDSMNDDEWNGNDFCRFVVLMRLSRKGEFSRTDDEE